MAHAEELLAAVLAVRATACLRGSQSVPWSVLEGEMECDLTGRSHLKSKARFLDGDGNRGRTPVDWFEEVRRIGALRVGILPTPAPRPGHRPVELAGKPVDAHRLHAFAGTGGVVLA